MNRIGPYEIAGLLATGGMAEILLGRRLGPSGFERVVVIKRILSTLARDVSYVNMFIDEARIAGRIHHPNVVQVFDLIIEHNLLCIVMEYLKGETLASLLRRVTSRGIDIEPELCSHIIAEAAAGLHAAHELVDQNKKPVGLVHRDISPQNVFVTYDGSVKILDFGIAKAKDRFTRTQTGQLKGSYAYMSPEQCRSENLDRRSDIFSLGVILYELSTGHQLFRRANHLLILKAIVDEPIALPSTIKPKYPKPLEKICLRALDREKSKRYQKASGLRHDLLKAFPSSDTLELPEARLSAFMQELFEDRIEEKEDLLRHLRQGNPISVFPAPETDLATEIPTVKAENALLTSMKNEPSVRRRRRPVSLLILALLLFGGALAVTIFMLSQSLTSPREPSHNASAAEVTGAKNSPLLQQEATLHIESNPERAQIFIDGVFQGVTPTSLKVPTSSIRMALKVSLEGYIPIQLHLIPEADQHLELKLEEDILLGNGADADLEASCDTDISCYDNIFSDEDPLSKENDVLREKKRRLRRWRWLRRHRQQLKQAAEKNTSKYRRFE